MKARYAYPLLFLLPSAMAAVLAAVLVAAGGAGILWIFVYGDGPWPEAASTVLMTLGAIAAAVTLLVLTALSYSVGKRREAGGGVRRSHVALALGLTVGLPLLVGLHQWQVGHLAGEPGPEAVVPAR